MNINLINSIKYENHRLKREVDYLNKHMAEREDQIADLKSELKALRTCKLCDKPFDKNFHKDCGGDCLLCMATVAEDPDCAIEVARLVLDRPQLF